MNTLRTIATITIATLICGNSAQAKSPAPAKITLVNGQTLEATISDRSSDTTVYAVFFGESTKVVRKIDRTQISSIEQLTVAPATSTVSKSGKTVAERALQAIRHPHVETLATIR